MLVWMSRRRTRSTSPDGICVGSCQLALCVLPKWRVNFHKLT